MDNQPSFIKCRCGNSMNEAQFRTHFQNCIEFKNSFRDFDSKFGELLKAYAEPKENLLIIRFLLKQYSKVIDAKINKLFPEIPFIDSDNNSSQFNHSSSSIKPISNPINPPFDPFKPPVKMQVASYENMETSDISCQICQSLNITYLDCCHPICVQCFQNEAERDFPNMKCRKCGALVHESYKKDILGKEKYDELDKRSLGKLLGNLVECPGCHEKNSFEPGMPDYKTKDDKGQIISKEAAEDHAKNRCRCAFCQINFCVNVKCLATPYHVGKTCEEYIRMKEATSLCRYDDEVITAKNKGPANHVCNHIECIEKYNNSCKKKLPCGHVCYGYQGETICPPCLNDTCPKFNNLFDQNAGSYCNICFTEGLGNAPVVLLSCNHYVHFKCIETRLKSQWIGPKITFNHCLCPVCNKWYNCMSNQFIQVLITQNTTLYREISDMAIKRLKFEDLDKDSKLKDPNSKWYGKDLEYALNRLSYYMCFLCKKPYFAGRRECGDGPNVNNDNPNRNYDPKDCVCGKHANLSGVAGVTECKTHGKEYIEYKCRFCCKIASWFCWGTTHFCEDCHARQCKGDYVSKYTKDKLPKCDPSICELKVKHPENGEEFALGCSVCRNAEANIKDF